MLTRPLIAIVAGMLIANAATAQNIRERVQDHQQILTGQAALDRDQNELQQMKADLNALQVAIQSGNTADRQRLQQQIHSSMVREVHQGEAKVAAYQREVGQSKAEVRTENREIRHNRRDSRRGLDRADDRRDMAADRVDRRDDQRDLQDDQQDRNAAIARVARQKAILQGITDPASVGMKKDLIEEFVRLMAADLADTRRELGEDHRELREDRRETRDDRRERRERR